MEDCRRNWDHKRTRAEETENELDWVREAINDRIESKRKRENNRRLCRKTCDQTLTENLLICLCFCGRHREEFPVHQMVNCPRHACRTRDGNEGKGDDEYQKASEKKEPEESEHGQMASINQDRERKPRTGTLQGGQQRGKVMSELLRQINHGKEVDTTDRQERGRLQDDHGSELHDTPSQKNMETRASDRFELADEQPKAARISTGLASQELGRNPQWLRPIQQIACRSPTEEREEIEPVQHDAPRNKSAGSEDFDQGNRQGTREQQNPLDHDGWIAECWERDKQHCSCYGWSQTCWSRTTEDWKTHTIECVRCQAWERQQCGVTAHQMKKKLSDDLSTREADMPGIKRQTNFCEKMSCVHEYWWHGEREIPWWACFRDECEEPIQQKTRRWMYPEMPKVTKVNTRRRQIRKMRRHHPRKETVNAFCQAGRIGVRAISQGKINLERLDGTEVEYENRKTQLKYWI
jgi:hypothetical protein